MEMQLEIQGFVGRRRIGRGGAITVLAKSSLSGHRELIVGSEIAPTKGSNWHDNFMQKNDFAFF
jgi:hypothetical protein